MTKTDDATFTFRVRGARFDQMPMERVAEYMRELAGLFYGGGTVNLLRVTKHTIRFTVKDK